MTHFCTTMLIDPTDANGESTNLLIPVSITLVSVLLLSLIVVGIICCCCDHDLNQILKRRKTHSEAMDMKMSDSNPGNYDRRIKYSYDQEEDEENKGQGYNYYYGEEENHYVQGAYYKDHTQGQ